MTFAQKVQLAFIGVMLALAAFFFYRNSQVQQDLSVNSWTESQSVGVDPKKNVTAANPEDPKARKLINGFGCEDGRVYIEEFPNADPPKNKEIIIHFSPETRGQDVHPYMHFHDPMSPVAKITNPFQHALAFVTYYSIYHYSLGLLGSTGMNADQLAKELVARNAMRAAVAVIDGTVETGTFHPELLNKVAAALAAYKAAPGNPTQNAAKARVAWNVINTAADYFNKQQEEKDTAIDTYMKSITALLSDEQKQKLVTAVDNYENAHNSTGRRNRAPMMRAGVAAPAARQGVARRGPSPAGANLTRGRAAPAPAH